MRVKPRRRGASAVEYIIAVILVGLSVIGLYTRLSAQYKCRIKTATALFDVNDLPECKAAPPATSYCFVAGTPVMTADGLQPIESLTPGTLVLSRDQEGGELDWRPIASTQTSWSRSLVRLTLVGGARQETLSVTPNHRLQRYAGDWVPAGELVPGRDELVDESGAPLTIAGAESLPDRVPVYNFEVAQFHTYFVGELGVWAHNAVPGVDTPLPLPPPIIVVPRGNRRTPIIADPPPPPAPPPPIPQAPPPPPLPVPRPPPRQPPGAFPSDPQPIDGPTLQDGRNRLRPPPTQSPPPPSPPSSPSTPNPPGGWDHGWDSPPDDRGPLSDENDHSVADAQVHVHDLEQKIAEQEKELWEARRADYRRGNGPERGNRDARIRDERRIEVARARIAALQAALQRAQQWQRQMQEYEEYQQRRPPAPDQQVATITVHTSATQNPNPSRWSSILNGNNNHNSWITFQANNSFTPPANLPYPLYADTAPLIVQTDRFRSQIKGPRPTTMGFHPNDSYDPSSHIGDGSVHIPAGGPEGASVTYPLTQAQVDSFTQYLNDHHASRYNYCTNNCSTWAAQAITATGNTPPPAAWFNGNDQSNNGGGPPPAGGGCG